MKKENDEITDLFRTRLADAGMSVRDGFWEELSQEIPVACQHRRRWRLRHLYCSFWRPRRLLSCISLQRRKWKKHLQR